MTITAKDLLLEAANLVDRGWTQHAYARGKDRYPIDPQSPDAVCWCALGAMRSAGPPEGDTFRLAVELLRRHVGVTVNIWNDGPDQTATAVAAKLREVGASA